MPGIRTLEQTLSKKSTMISPKTKRYIRQIVPFSLIWGVFALLYVLLEKGLLGDLDYYPATKNPYDFKNNLLITVPSAIFSGFIFGFIEVLYLNNLFTKYSFRKKIIFKTLISMGFMMVFLIGTTLISNSIEIGSNVFDQRVWNNLWIFLSNFAFWSIEMYVAFIIMISLFYLEISENLGQGILHNFFTGKYHQPIEEERIFMFCDMKSSTTIAESLGHVKFFEMLRTYYSDLSDPVIEYAGEIYQYVGDEIVVSWTLKNGLDKDNCFKCFFAMKAALAIQAKKYQDTFGLVPTFKAGFHYGKVTTGEIGEVKKEILFTGDVLNTTARIQGLCNSYDVDILISDQLIEKANLKGRFQVTALGESELRGRDEKVELHTIDLLS